MREVVKRANKSLCSSCELQTASLQRNNKDIKASSSYCNNSQRINAHDNLQRLLIVASVSQDGGTAQA